MNSVLLGSRRRLAAAIVGGLVGAALWPITVKLLWLTDEPGYRGPELYTMAIAYLWFVLSLPGAWIANQGYLTLAVISVFWGGLYAWLATRLVR